MRFMTRVSTRIVSCSMATVPKLKPSSHSKSNKSINPKNQRGSHTEAPSMAITAAREAHASGTAAASPRSLSPSKQAHHNFFVWREFVWGGIAGAFGEGMMHPIDTVKTRIQSQAIFAASKHQKNILQMVRKVWAVDGVKGFYRGLAPGVTGSLATGATYFGVIESTKKWIEESHPNLGGHWAHFIAGAVGDTLGTVVYVPCEVMKQRMQVQGTKASWGAVMLKDNLSMKPGIQMYDYYTGMFQAGCSIWKEQGARGLYAGFGSTLARDVPFAGLMVMFYEGLKDLTENGKKKYIHYQNFHINTSFEGLILGGMAGGMSSFLTTPFDVIKTRMQVQGSTLRYKGWWDALRNIWITEGAKGMFKGSIPRVTWYIPASALTFMAVEFLRDHFKEGASIDSVQEVASLAVDKKNSPLQGSA